LSVLHYWVQGYERAIIENEKIMEIVTACAVDVNWTEFHSWTALHCAAERLWYDHVKAALLLQHGADIAARDTYECTPLMVAVIVDNYPAVWHLIEQNARVDTKSSVGDTILHLAMLKSTISTWRVLIETLRSRVDEIDVLAKNEAGCTFYDCFWEERDEYCFVGRGDRETEFPVFQELVRTFLGEDFELDRDAYGNWIGESDINEDSLDQDYSTEEFWDAEELQRSVPSDGPVNKETTASSDFMS
jgi:hypothetical protein